MMSKMENKKESAEYYYEEIDLADYVRVVLKRKWLLALTFLFIFLGGAGITFLMPEVYEGEMVLEIGEIDGKPSKNLKELVAEIENGIYGEGFKAESSKGVEIVKVSKTGEKKEDLKQALIEFKLRIEKEFEKIVEGKKEVIELQIKEEERELGYLQEQKKSLEKQINTLQPYAFYDEGLAPQLAYFRLKNDLAGKENKIQKTGSHIDWLEKKKDNAKGLRVVKKPHVENNPVEPNVKLNLAISFVLASFSSVFVVFLVNWWEESFAEKKNF